MLLHPDPCSLLDPITPATRARWPELSKDYDGQGGRLTDQSNGETRLALTLEAAGILTAAATRPRWDDAQDGQGQIWDFKGRLSHSTAVLDRGNGSGQIRDCGPNGVGSKDFDFGHDHGAGDPHAHDWIGGVRQPGRPILPGE